MYLVAGLGITGQAVIDYLVSQQEPVIGFEELNHQNYDLLRNKYPKLDFYFEQLPDSVLEKCDLIYLSPGIPQNRAWIEKAKRMGIKLSNEIELAFKKATQPIIAVTGTNGKSTTVSLIDYVINHSSVQSKLCGNIGQTFIEVVKDKTDYFVLELSSFQLELIDQFSPKIAVLLNITPDHLDRYSSMKEYADAKQRITANQTKEDYLVYNADDMYCQKIATSSIARKIPFSLLSQKSEGGWVKHDKLMIKIDDEVYDYELREISLKGLHNQENLLASLITLNLLKIDQVIIKSALKSFKGLAHRMEEVAKINEVIFYNDSKATNVGATSMALASFEKDIILIMGGKNKDNNFEILKGLLEFKVKHLVLIGEARFVINDQIGGTVPTILLPSMKDAIEKIFKIMKKGDIVLLSPGCASFDQYKNYKDRGEDFKKWTEHYQQGYYN